LESDDETLYFSFVSLVSPISVLIGLDMKKTFLKPLNDEEIYQEVIRTITKYLPDARVYLFGSRAKGTAKPYSDFDIAIEWKEKIPLYTMAKIREELDKLPTLKSFDLIDLKRVSGDFIETVRKTGVILYDGRKFKEET
jgi:predicted nucleotidyltransferase